MRTTAALVRTLSLAAALALLLGPVSARAGSPYRKGEVVRIEGRLLDPAGTAIAAAHVVLTAERAHRRLLHLGRGDLGPVAASTSSDADGHYAIDWVWDRFHDTFVIEVVLPPMGDHPEEVLARLDISDRLVGGSPIEVDLEVAKGSLVRFVQHLATGPLSRDEQKLLDELGWPLRYEEQLRAGEIESTWWYFERGRLYRFRDGALEQVTHFDPVLPEP